MALTGKHFEVDSPLSDVVKHFYTIQTTADHPEEVHHLSPNFEMLLIFNFSNPVGISFAGNPIEDVKVERTGILGPLRKMLNYEVKNNTDILVTTFNLDGFYRLFQMPMDTLDGQKIIQTENLLNNELWKTLKDTRLPDDRIQILGDYILSVIKTSEDSSIPLLDGAAYFDNPLIQPVKAIATDTKLSERTIQSRFKKYTGYSPKELLRFLRFKQVINTIEQNPDNNIDWYDLIHDFGYHDQSHLIKDFNHFLGTTPQNFIKKFAGKKFCTTGPGKHYS